ncbi:ATP12 family chaperone protein [Rhizomicrobium electricum]|uniref:ATPase n=1 Tax=Rhizomicrobium electricum TaxID=480070 RepID=A0ABN1E256_9PROT|nr:ATP12 family protein [Rhizomicrobium electricum]NIJ47436.1 chaperone required for assembly of F1-ATPase [Rhizomicrobium electricum]
MKRFYKEVSVSAAPFRILLDGRPVKTPARAPLELPTLAFAEAIAEEWREQGDEIAPDAMVLTKLANTALDRVAPMREGVIGQVMGFLNDLLCYRAEHPAELVTMQSAEWDPLLDWAAERYGVRLRTRPGIVHFAQSDEAVAAFRRAVEAYDPFALTALATVAPILGSLVLALALAEGRLDAEAAFSLSQLDERFQVERWGRDTEAEKRAAGLLDAVKVAESFLRLSKQ